MPINLKRSSVILAVFLLAGCGGGGGSSTPPAPPPAPVDTTAPTLEVSPSDLSVTAGEDLEFTVTATDSSGFGTTNVTCTEGSVATSSSTSGNTQTVTTTFSAPVTAGTVNCTATSTDSASNSGNLDFSITVDPLPVNTSDFNGTWFSPCYNNSSGFSVRQTIRINGGSLESDIESFTAGENPARNCRVPADGALITGEARASLNFNSDFDLGSCVNDRAVNTDVNVTRVDTSGNPTATSEPLISDTLNLITGFVNILPSSTSMCRLNNGNLLFAGVEYTAGSNTSIILPTFDLASNVTWSMGSNSYIAGTSNGSDSPVDNRSTLVVGTDSDTSNGDFSGSSITFSYTTNGSGVYKVTTLSELVAADPLDTEAQLVVIGVSVGIGVGTTATNYESSQSNGFVIAVVDEDGRYHFSTDAPLTLGKSIEVGGGVPDAPDEFDLEMTNIFDFQN